ncbi:MAG: hypothetical protein ACK59J_22810, partial [Pseudanabaena sp.]
FKIKTQMIILTINKNIIKKKIFFGAHHRPPPLILSWKRVNHIKSYKKVISISMHVANQIL